MPDVFWRRQEFRTWLSALHDLFPLRARWKTAMDTSQGFRSRFHAKLIARDQRSLGVRSQGRPGPSRERKKAELVAHLAALNCRPGLFAGKGYGSLFAYCTQALRLSEDAACHRIEVAKACRRFPVILGLLSSGAMTLTSVRVLGRHLTPENHQAVLEKAKGRTCHQIEALVAELAPRPDVPTSIRRAETLRSLIRTPPPGL
jgi:hypothetical protein